VPVKIVGSVYHKVIKDKEELSGPDYCVPCLHQGIIM
jgi:hypothetical protein